MRDETNGSSTKPFTCMFVVGPFPEEVYKRKQYYLHRVVYGGFVHAIGFPQLQVTGIPVL